MQGCKPCLAHTPNQWLSLLPASLTPRYTTGSIFLSHSSILYVCMCAFDSVLFDQALRPSVVVVPQASLPVWQRSIQRIHIRGFTPACATPPRPPWQGMLLLGARSTTTGIL